MGDFYREPAPISIQQVQALINARDWDRVRVAIISIALHEEDGMAAATLLRSLATHDNEEIRGNAVLGFGHLARRFGSLDESAIRPLVESALVDSSEYVRGQAWAASDDITHFLGWSITGFYGD